MNYPHEYLILRVAHVMLADHLNRLCIKILPFIIYYNTIQKSLPYKYKPTDMEIVV